MSRHPDLDHTYPVQLLLTGRPALVVGAGKVAVRKIGGLVRAGAAVTVVAPQIHPEINELPVTVHERPYRQGEAASYQLVITCTDDAHVNRQVFRDAEAAGVWVNSADDPVNCSFILPSVARQGDLTITVSTNGQSPAMAMWLRRRFEAEFDERYNRLMDLLVEVRAEARYVFGTSEVKGWNAALDDGVFDLVAAGEIDAARTKLRTSLGLDRLPAEPGATDATQLDDMAALLRDSELRDVELPDLEVGV